MDIRAKPGSDADFINFLNRYGCPRTEDDLRAHGGFKPYYGITAVFHCGYSVYLENRLPTPDAPQLECAYDPAGRLVVDHPCSGTANQYDAETSPFNHTVRDDGGVARRGASAAFHSFWQAVSNFFIPPAW